MRPIQDERKPESELIAELRQLRHRIAMLEVTHETSGQMQLEFHQLLAIIDSADDAIMTHDLCGTVSRWNKAAERTLGYPAEEMIVRSIEVLGPDGHSGTPQITYAVP